MASGTWGGRVPAPAGTAAPATRAGPSSSRSPSRNGRRRMTTSLEQASTAGNVTRPWATDPRILRQSDRKSKSPRPPATGANAPLPESPGLAVWRPVPPGGGPGGGRGLGLLPAAPGDLTRRPLQVVHPLPGRRDQRRRHQRHPGEPQQPAQGDQDPPSDEQAAVELDISLGGLIGHRLHPLSPRSTASMMPGHRAPGITLTG